MYRALYPFQKTHPTSLSFEKNDVFLSLPGANSDKNWHCVLDQKGLKGFVPRNYVKKEEKLPSKEEYENLLTKIREAILSQRMGEKDRADLLGKVEELRKTYQNESSPNNKQNNTGPSNSSKVPAVGANNSSGELEVSSNLPKAPSPRPDSLSSNEDGKGSSKYKTKRAAPQPPCRKSSNEPIYEPLRTDPPSHNNSTDAVDSGIDSLPPQKSKVPDKFVKSSSKKNGSSTNSNLPPVDAIAIVSNSSNDNSKCNTANGNEIATKPQSTNAVNVQDSKQGKGVRVSNKSFENTSDSRKSSIGSKSGSKFLMCRTSSIAEPTQEQIRTEARGLVEVVRELTGLSHTMSQTTALTVLQYVNDNMARLDRNVPVLIDALEKPVYCAAEEIAGSSDTKNLEDIFLRLQEVKNDTEQRNWTVHDDNEMIISLLTRLNDSLQTCDRNVSLYVMRRRKYEYIFTLVEYFQMETRRPIRSLLLDTFFIMCALDPSSVISLLLNSVLPLELVQDLYAHTPITTGVNKRKGDFQLVRLIAILLTVIFSRGEPMPVQYSDHGALGRNFVDFVLEMIEQSALSRTDDVSDVFIGLMLSFNLQFEPHNVGDNFFIERLAMQQGAGHGAKTYTEKILLLLNREEDPAAVVGRDVTEKDPFDDDYDVFTGNDDLIDEDDRKIKNLPNSVAKVILDMFRHKHARNLFYTNDLYVLIDIIIRQLTDLCPDDKRRYTYLQMCQLVLNNGVPDYNEHLHRFKDLQERFMRILEEDDSKEKSVVLAMCKSVSAFNSLVMG